MDDGSITRLLKELEAGAPGAEDRLFERVYTELRAMAGARNAGERDDGAAGDSTDIVHDAYMRIGAEGFENRRHLFFAYARAMRQLLIERARRRGALKRGGGRKRVALSMVDADAGDKTPQLSALDIDALLERLSQVSERESQVVQLRCFGGLPDATIASLLGVSVRTVRSDWSNAQQRLASWLEE